MKFKNVPIIVTPRYGNELIEEILIDNNINYYTMLDELPSELIGYGSGDVFDYFKQIKLHPTCNIIYGLNVYSLIVYELFKYVHNTTFILIPEKEIRPEKLKAFMENSNDANIKLYDDLLANNEMVVGNVFMTVCANENLLSDMFPNSIIVNCYDLSDKFKIYHNEKLLQFKNKFLDRKRCFIIATGPSLIEDDICRLYDNKEFCISMNRIFALKSKWKPDIYVFTDGYGQMKFKKEILSFNVPVKIIGDGNMDFWKKSDTEGLYKIHVVSGDTLRLMNCFSEEIEQKVYDNNTVTYVCLQIAVYFGFKEIYLLGVDCNYLKNSNKNYFFEDDEVDTYNHYEDKMIQAYEKAKRYADTHGIVIYNATRGGMLEVFERVSFDDIF